MSNWKKQNEARWNQVRKTKSCPVCHVPAGVGCYNLRHLNDPQYGDPDQISTIHRERIYA